MTFTTSNINLEIQPLIVLFLRSCICSKTNTLLLHVLIHNTLIHIQYSIINFVPCGYDTLLIFYIVCVLSTLAEGHNIMLWAFPS